MLLCSGCGQHYPDCDVEACQQLASPGSDWPVPLGLSGESLLLASFSVELLSISGVHKTNEVLSFSAGLQEGGGVKWIDCH